MITITLIYADGSTWFAGGFNTLEAANAWADKEQTKPYWDFTTQISIINTDAE